VCPDDTGNDTLMTATDSGTFPTSPLTLTGTIGAVTDADWYRFRLIGASTDLPYVVRLTGIAPVNNYNLGVYFDCGGEVLVSCAGGSIATEPYSGCLSTAGLGADELVTAMASCSRGVRDLR
jgi:hypothetical protein